MCARSSWRCMHTPQTPPPQSRRGAARLAGRPPARPSAGVLTRAPGPDNGARVRSSEVKRGGRLRFGKPCRERGAVPCTPPPGSRRGPAAGPLGRRSPPESLRATAVPHAVRAGEPARNAGAAHVRNRFGRPKRSSTVNDARKAGGRWGTPRETPQGSPSWLSRLVRKTLRKEILRRFEAAHTRQRSRPRCPGNTRSRQCRGGLRALLALRAQRHCAPRGSRGGSAARRGERRRASARTVTPCVEPPPPDGARRQRLLRRAPQCAARCAARAKQATHASESEAAAAEWESDTNGSRPSALRGACGTSRRRSLRRTERR